MVCALVAAAGAAAVAVSPRFTLAPVDGVDAELAVLVNSPVVAVRSSLSYEVKGADDALVGDEIDRLPVIDGEGVVVGVEEGAVTAVAAELLLVGSSDDPVEDGGAEVVGVESAEEGPVPSAAIQCGSLTTAGLAAEAKCWPAFSKTSP